jgi:NCS1 family nucleobase:cation symporter-1
MKQTAQTVDPQLAAGAQASSLYNDDLAPTGVAQRTWKWYHFAALWVGMVMNIASYMLAAGLTEQGMSPWQAVVTVLLGNLIVLVPMLLIGHAGAKHGVRLSLAAGTVFKRGLAAARSIRCSIS